MRAEKSPFLTAVRTLRSCPVSSDCVRIMVSPSAGRLPSLRSRSAGGKASGREAIVSGVPGRFFWYQTDAPRKQRGAGAVGQVQLLQDMAHMDFHGALAQKELLRDLPVGEPAADAREHFLLALGKRRVRPLELRRLAREILQLLDQPAGGPAVDPGLVRSHDADRLRQVSLRRELGQEPLGAGAERVQDHLLAAVHGQYQNARR